MAYTARTQEEILAELQDWTRIDSAKIEGTFAYDVLASNAIEFQKVEMELAEAYNASFGHTAWGEYLELRAAESGVIRRRAKKAIGKLTVTGNGIVYAGSIFATEAGTRFVATSDTEVKGTVTIDIEAEKAGSSGNVGAGSIMRIPLNIRGIQSSLNFEATFDGYDEEDDDSLRERYLTKVRYPANSGNPRQYVEWAMSVVGVGAARCIRCPEGPGTVRLVVVDSNFEEANVELLKRVYDYVENERPVGADVSVISARPLAIDIKAKVYGAFDVDAFKRGVKGYFLKMARQNLLDYRSAARDGGYVSVAQIGSYIIADGGADDYDDLTLNGGATNVLLKAEQIPAIGKVEFE